MTAATAISAVFAGAGLFMSYRQYQATIAGGKIQQQAYEAQARNRRLEGRIEAVSAKEKANEILRRAKVALASNIAGGYASAVNPFIGSVDTVSKQQILRPAALDVNVQEEEALLAVEKADREARYLEYRGQMAQAQARSSALSGLGMAALQVGLSGAFSALTPNLSLDLGNRFGMGRSAMTTTPVTGNLAVGGGLNTAGSSLANFSTNPMFFNQMSPVNTSALNTAGGPSFMGI